MSGELGFGSSIAYNSTGSTYVPFANITRVQPFSGKADSVDISAMDSPSKTREKISGMLDSGQATFDLNWNAADSTHAWLLTNLGVTKLFKVTIGTVTFSFSGFVSAVPPAIPFDNKCTCTVTIEISGVITPGTTS